jgi:hypothetical protein
MEIVVRSLADRREPGLEPESLLPCQFGDRLFGAARLQPEKRLQLAVLQDALLTFHRLLGVDGARSRRLFAEVDAWFAPDEANGPFTFVTVCHTLNLDPDYIRRGLGRWRADANGAARRRPPFRRDAIGMRHRVVTRPLRRSA